MYTIGIGCDFNIVDSIAAGDLHIAERVMVNGILTIK